MESGEEEGRSVSTTLAQRQEMGSCWRRSRIWEARGVRLAEEEEVEGSEVDVGGEEGEGMGGKRQGPRGLGP